MPIPSHKVRMAGEGLRLLLPAVQVASRQLWSHCFFVHTRHVWIVTVSHCWFLRLQEAKLGVCLALDKLSHLTCFREFVLELYRLLHYHDFDELMLRHGDVSMEPLLFVGVIATHAVVVLSVDGCLLRRLGVVVSGHRLLTSKETRGSREDLLLSGTIVDT